MKKRTVAEIAADYHKPHTVEESNELLKECARVMWGPATYPRNWAYLASVALRKAI